MAVNPTISGQQIDEISDRQELEAIIEEADKVLATEEAFHRLLANPDFKSIILDGLCRNDCAAYNVIINSPNIQPNQSDSASKFLTMAGIFPHWLDAKELLYRRAKEDKAKAQEDLDSLLSNGG